MKLRIQLGLNIQEARRSKGFSQETLAHRADIDRGYIGKIENAKHAASIDMVEAIAEALGIEPRDLLNPRFRVLFDKPLHSLTMAHPIHGTAHTLR